MLLVSHLVSHCFVFWQTSYGAFHPSGDLAYALGIHGILGRGALYSIYIRNFEQLQILYMVVLYLNVFDYYRCIRPNRPSVSNLAAWYSLLTYIS